jgi:sugar lactone lactonase YvrE
MLNYESTRIQTGLYFGEAPRWHDGRLWYSDFYRQGVFSIDAGGGNERRELTVDQQPSGLGWLPDGSLLVVSMIDQRVLRFADGELREHCDMSAYCTFWANDMVVGESGVAYAGNFGFDLDTFLRDSRVEGAVVDPPATTNLVVMDPSGNVIQTVDDMSFPNGSVITPDGATLIVAETVVYRLTAFDVAANGTLSNRRLYAQLDFVAADGICLDEEGQVWVANPLTNGCVRVREGGEITATATATQNVFACMLGGDDRRTLYLVTAPTSSRFEIAEQSEGLGAIESVRVEVAGAGRP